MSTGLTFRVGQQVVIDPPRSVRVTPAWEKLESRYLHEFQRKDLGGIILEVPEQSSRKHGLVYDVLVYPPPIWVKGPRAVVGDKVTLPRAALQRFPGGVLKSASGVNPGTYPIGIVVEFRCLSDVCGLRDCVKVCSLGRDDDFTWYSINDVQAVDNWENRLRTGVPESHLRDVRGQFSRCTLLY